MRLSELDYELPEELIAQEPLARRDEARLMVLDRRAATAEHSRFYKLARYLREGDLLVLNDTRVFPARLRARKESGGAVELLMLRPVDEPAGGWLAMTRSHRPVRENGRLELQNGAALRVAAFSRPGRPVLVSDNGVSIEAMIAEFGEPALPYYIRRAAGRGDRGAYQTVYAVNPGAVAAPTAGLHFTPELLAELRNCGVRSAALTLHIGPGTFAPVRSPEVEGHSMEPEWYAIPPDTAAAVEHARRTGARVIAIGTSTTRALESFAITGDAEGFTGLFISPGFRFRLVNGMITNFHMPRSTMLAMVIALVGRAPLLVAYTEAVRRRYRFLSYGDAMLIL